nr:single-stranded DNA-binding protein [uncultured Mediterraneibacter sp.]
MNKVILIGRLTRNPEVRYSTGENSKAVARYTLAVDRKLKRENEATADFIRCVAIGRLGEIADKYFRQGMRIAISGHLQTGSYTNKEGMKIYTVEVFIEEQEFAEIKSENKRISSDSEEQQSGDEFTYLSDEYDDELPFE